MTYTIIDDSKEFRLSGDTVLLAMLNSEQEIHLSINENIEGLFKDKTNLYELISEEFEKGNYMNVSGYKILILNNKNFEERGTIQ